VIEGAFYEFKKQVFNPFSFLGFRSFNLTLGRFSWIGYWLKSLLVRVLIYRKRNLDVRLKRRVSVRPDRFSVRDQIQGTAGDRVETLNWVDVFTTIHMGSSRYFVPNDLHPGTQLEQADCVSLDVSQLEEGLILERTISTG
jgi:hypothetical protein